MTDQLDLGIDVPGETKRPAAAPSCAGCGASWTGSRPCHCAAPGCHQTFAGLTLFDAHRSTRGGEHGSCLDPLKLDGVEFRDGMWRSPEMSDEVKAKAFGRSS